VGSEAVVHIPESPSIDLRFCHEGDLVYYLVDLMGYWTIMQVCYSPEVFELDSVVDCEVVAESHVLYGAGCARRIGGHQQVWRFTEMEVLAWAAK
jgi:hypothetical protein